MISNTGNTDLKTTSLGRFEGRLFAEAGQLYMVVEANEDTGIARVSCRIDGRQQVLDMPVAEVSKRLSSGAPLALDSVGSDDMSKRIVQKPDGWFFSAREGLKGPYSTGEEAERELSQHILAAQD